ncbi:chaplin [Streptomyces sp. NPDC002574]|uniref:chaplin n=1 Tax=Streptomyces sp. NPDC002574 TaxID=3364652 RepID=UPI0036BB9F2A
MKRFSKAAVLTVAAGAAVLGSAGGALADGGYGGGYGGGGYGGGYGGFGRGGAHADGAAIGSPGVLSGNAIQVPVNIPVNVCGNGVNVLLSLVNPTVGNVCLND